MPKVNVSVREGESFHLVNRVRPRRTPAMARLGPGNPEAPINDHESEKRSIAFQHQTHRVE